MTDWTIILRSMRSRLFSTVTTVITVAVAVALMLVLLTMRDASRKAFEQGGGSMHLLLSRDASPFASVLNGIFFVNAPRAPIQHSELEQFLALPQARAMIDWAIPLQLGDSYEARWPVVATTPEFFTRFQPFEDRPWSFSRGQGFEADFEVVVGATAAREAGLSVGDRITLTHGFPTRDAAPDDAAHEHNEFTYRIVGVLEPTGQAFDRAVFTSLMSTWIIHAHDRIEREAHAEVGEEGQDHDHSHGGAPTTTASDVTAEDKKITNIYVRVASRPGSSASAALPVVFERLRRNQFFPGVITVAQPRQEMNRLMNIVGNVDKILLAIAGIVMVASSIAVMLALYNSMEQRRRQIAVLRVLGASRARVLGLVLTESAVIGLLGAAAGTALAAVGAWIAAAYMKEELGIFIDPALDPRQLIVVAIATVLLASLAGLVPATAAYRTPVQRNLRPLG